MIVSHWVETNWIITHRITLKITNTIFKVLFNVEFTPGGNIDEPNPAYCGCDAAST
jgi:hypothetical protein